jgi:propanol-preferring alcohol dehydrogenase
MDRTCRPANPGSGEIRVKVLPVVFAAPICMSWMANFPDPKIPIIPGHEIVGRIDLLGAGVKVLKIGERVGIPWLGHTCGVCPYCLEHRKIFATTRSSPATPATADFATMVIADARFAFPLGETGSDVSLAPLLCAGLIGWRSLVIAGEGKKIGLYGFGAAAHIIAQVAKWQGRSVFAFTRPGDLSTQAFARSLGAFWAGGSNELPPEPLDAAIIFATVGDLVPSL